VTLAERLAQRDAEWEAMRAHYEAFVIRIAAEMVAIAKTLPCTKRPHAK
jgi:hypothetical protein